MATKRMVLLLGVVALFLGAACEEPPAQVPDEVKEWRAWKCPTNAQGEGMTILQRLSDIIDKAADQQRGSPTVLPPARKCRDEHTAKITLHCAMVYAAHRAAVTAFVEPDAGKRGALWALCKSELEHDEIGGGAN